MNINKIKDFCTNCEKSFEFIDPSTRELYRKELERFIESIVRTTDKNCDELSKSDDKVVSAFMGLIMKGLQGITTASSVPMAVLTGFGGFLIEYTPREAIIYGTLKAKGIYTPEDRKNYLFDVDPVKIEVDHQKH